MLKSPFFILLLLLVLMSPLAQAATDCAAVTEIPSTECEALIALYNSTDGANWLRNDWWNVTNTPCSWYGVSCSEGHVSDLYLSSNQITGSIPTELGNLTHLTALSLSSNQITGSIPTELGNLTNLTGLNLSNNQLTGEIPTELGNLSNLSWLELSNNQLTGEIPTELGNLSKLAIFNLSDNSLCGEIPVELKNLSLLFLGLLGVLKLDNNHLTTSDSSLIAWLDSRSPGWDTTQTSCSGFFTTPIVKVAENAGTVTLTVQRNGDTNGTLEIDYATTEGSAVQGHDYIGATGTLYWAGGDSTDKSFTITINDDSNSEINETFTIILTDPVSGESLDNVTIVIEENEPVDCAVVTKIPSTECEILIDLYNSTGGANWQRNTGWNVTNMPCSWYGVSCSGGHVSGLDLSGNQLTSSIPTELGNLTNLTYLDMSGNQLTGSIPTELGNLSNLTYLVMSGNQLTGSIPTELGNLSNLTYLSLSSNQLTGSIPSELGNLSELSQFYLSGNQLTGSIPSELGNLSELSQFYLSRNQLTGSIPSELGNLSELTRLHLDNNQLTGSIPSELGNLSNLTGLHLDNNQLTGSIPSELGNLTDLGRLYLYSNQLTGSIPKELGNLSNLWVLDLYSNNLTGSIPKELGNLSNLTSLALYSNQLTGEIPKELGNLSNLSWLRLDNNELCGEIPVELKNLSNIPLSDQYGAKLRLDNNHLTASDPELIAWLDSRNPGWETTQTPCPVVTTLQFSSTTYNVTENGGQATITVTRTGNGAISANYATTDGTATAGNDYTQTTGTLSWANGDWADKTITIAITDDGDSEGNETFTIRLTSPISGENLDNAIVTISDNDTTLVTLNDFTATALETGILLEWQTATEFDNAGFHLWRASGEGWKYGDYSTVIRLTEQLIAAQGDFSVYSYIDADVETGATYYYGLEDIDLNGQSTFHWNLIDSATAR